ncbi:MAG: lipoyl synthase [Candidatus Omnitrophota bacterium]|jgi:lipoic acid synthetase
MTIKPHARKPRWLNKKINLGDCQKVKTLLNGLRVNTVCREASCPNIGECFAKNQATFLILGAVCTRSCTFCGVRKAEPLPVDPDEPFRVAEAARKLGLKHVVITSVTRDDLDDGGAHYFAETISAIRAGNGTVTIEALIPDFQLNTRALVTVVEAAPDIIGHNIECVPRLYQAIRLGSDYARSLAVLRTIKEIDRNIYTKSGIMLGLGEARPEVGRVFRDLVKTGCDFISIGQYLSPSVSHAPVKEYICPEDFEYYRQQAKAAGFRHVVSGPYVRSSYLAGEYLDKK